MTFRIIFSDVSSIIGIFTGKKSNNLAHAQAVDSRPSFKGRYAVKGGYSLRRSRHEEVVIKQGMRNEGIRNEE